MPSSSGLWASINSWSRRDCPSSSVRPAPVGLPVRQLGTVTQAGVDVGGPPAADGLAGDAEDVGQIGLGEAQLAAAGPQAEDLKALIGQLSCVG